MPNTSQAQSDPDREQYLDRARELMQRTPLIDGHNDLPWAARETHALSLDSLDISQPQPSKMTDLPRLREGLVGGQFWVAYSPSSFHHRGAPRVGFEQVDFIHRMVERYPGDLQFAGTADEVMAAFRNGRVASLIGLEGGHMIENSLGVLRQFYARGVRYMTLTHSRNTDWADAATDDERHGGLTPFGEEVIREMNRLGMMVDLSHTSDSTMWDVLRVTEAPIIYSHSSSRRFTPHKRNVPDDIASAVGENGGVIMVNYVPSFIYRPSWNWYQQRDALQGEEQETWTANNPLPLPGIETVVDHIDHLRDVIGVDHVGIGADFDGINTTPVGLEDVSTFPYLIAEMISRGWEDEDIAKVMGLNVLRVMREVESAAARIRMLRGPSYARIEIVDQWDTGPEWTDPREQ
ncbi:MAG: dipeptidase [Gemmatimonadales bacterium]